jgi:glycosyltransferase involved in cell wall biosynthesis
MPQNIKLGIVTSTYQRPDGKTPELLTRTLKCLLDQTLPKLEVIFNRR